MKKRYRWNRIGLCLAGLLFIIFFVVYFFIITKEDKIVKSNIDIEKDTINSNYNEKEADFLFSLIGLPHYDSNRKNRYLNYMNKSLYNPEQIIRVVNTDNDLERFVDAKAVELKYGNLILVNKYNYLDKNYVPDDLVTIDSKYSTWGSLKRDAYTAFINMAKAAESEGYYFVNCSPYRSYETQKNLYNSYVSSNGFTEAERFSARPGYSEHQAGLAVDVKSKTSTMGGFENTREFGWMKKNSYKYGFILRYPEGMEYITGYMYEPWHYRYVGVEAATFIYNNNLTFEEYYYYYVKKDFD